MMDRIGKCHDGQISVSIEQFNHHLLEFNGSSKNMAEDRIELDWIAREYDRSLCVCVCTMNAVCCILYVAQVNIFGIEKRLFQITVIIVVYLFYTVC